MLSVCSVKLYSYFAGALELYEDLNINNANSLDCYDKTFWA